MHAMTVTNNGFNYFETRNSHRDTQQWEEENNTATIIATLIPSIVKLYLKLARISPRDPSQLPNCIHAQ
jgi:hypothetical protein